MRKHKIKRISLFAFIMLIMTSGFFSASLGNAATTYYFLDFISGGFIPSAYVTAEVNDISGGVEYTLKVNTLGDGESITGWYLNYPPGDTAPNITSSGCDNSPGTHSQLMNSIKAGDDGYFDFMWAWGINQFDYQNNEYTCWLTGDISSSSFMYRSLDDFINGNPDGFYMAVMIDKEDSSGDSSHAWLGASLPIPSQPAADDLLGFFGIAKDGGYLVGDGPTNQSATQRLNSFENMLIQAQYYIDQGLTSEACIQLDAAYMKTDGNPVPPDFVSGDAAQSLADIIQSLMETIGCE